jgi:hypothetical protein
MLIFCLPLWEGHKMEKILIQIIQTVIKMHNMVPLMSLTTDLTALNHQVHEEKARSKLKMIRKRTY